MPGLEGPGRLGEHAHALEELGRPQEVLASLEVGGRLRGAAFLEGQLPPQVGRFYGLAGPVEGLGGLGHLLALQVQLGGLLVLGEGGGYPSRRNPVLAPGQDLQRPLRLAGLLVELARLERALLIGRDRGRRVGGAVGDVLHEVPLEALGGLEESPVLLVRSGRPLGVAALLEQGGGLLPLLGLGVEAGGFEVVPTLLEQRGRLLGPPGSLEHQARLLEVAGLDVQLPGALQPPEPFQGGRRRPGFLPLHVDGNRLVELPQILVGLPGGEVVAALLELGDVFVPLGFGVRLPEDHSQDAVPAQVDFPDLQLVAEPAVQDVDDDQRRDPGHVRVGKQARHDWRDAAGRQASGRHYSRRPPTGRFVIVDSGRGAGYAQQTAST